MQINSVASGVMNTTTSKLNETKTNDFQKKMDEALKSKDDKALTDVCKQFETYFINTIIKEMRQTLGDGKDNLIPKSQGENTFTEMVDSEYSKKATDKGGIGLANMMYKQLKATQSGVKS